MALLIRAVDSNGDTVEFYFSKHLHLTAAKRFIRKTLVRHGRPEHITINGSETNRIVIVQCDAECQLRHTGKPIAVCSSKYMNNIIEQDHCLIKRRTRCIIAPRSEPSSVEIKSLQHNPFKVAPVHWHAPNDNFVLNGGIM